MASRMPDSLVCVIFGLCAATLPSCAPADKNNTRALSPPATQTDMMTTAATQPASLYALPLANENTLQLISRYARFYDLPEQLVRRVVSRESKGNPAARNGPYWGLMQISYPTAQSMGYKGRPEGLLDAETNLRYAVKYLAGAYLVADGDERQSVNLYARGYYYDAKRKGLLEATGLRPAQHMQ